MLFAEWMIHYLFRVLNTDNMSILGLTIDYGPFGFLDHYDPGHVCNASGTFFMNYIPVGGGTVTSWLVRSAPV